MAPPIYFFPKRTLAQVAPQGRLLRSLLQDVQLDRAWCDVEIIPRDASCFESVVAGPGGASGVMLCAIPPGQTPIRVGYAPEFQEWTEAIPDKLWIGTDTEHPIEPADLARAVQMPGYPVELAGQTWTIPVIRDYLGGTGLPCDWDVGPGGEVTERIAEKYRDLWERWVSVVDIYFDEDDPRPAGVFDIPNSEAMARGVDVLSINYRFGQAMQNVLHLIGGDTWTPLLFMSIDGPTHRDVWEAVVQKKTLRDLALAAESSATSPGPAADCPATDPAEPTSNCSPAASE
jgi:hypothetical protein